MKQIITINLGQPGIEVSDETLSLYLYQHRLASNSTNNSSQQTEALDHRPFFRQTVAGHHIYRSISVDCDRTAIQSLLTGKNKQYYRSKSQIGTWSSSGGVYSLAQKIARTELTEQFCDQFRKSQEECDNLQGVIFNGCTLGGSSGLFDSITTQLAEQNCINKTPKIGYLIFPSKNINSNIYEIYNHALTANSILNYIDLAINFDNQSLYYAAQHHFDIDTPGFKDINKIISQVQSSVSLSMRSQGTLNMNFRDLLTNTVCYPRIHYLYPSFVGLPGDLRSSSVNTVEQLLRTIFDPTSHLYDMHKVENKIAAALFFRGNAAPYQVASSVGNLRAEAPPNCVFEEWSPLGFKYSLNDFPSQDPLFGRRTSLTSPSCLGLINSLEFTFPIAHSNRKFDYLYSKRAFVHHFVAGEMQEMQMSEARQDLAALEKDYQPCRCYEVYDEQQQVQ